MNISEFLSSCLKFRIYLSFFLFIYSFNQISSSPSYYYYPSFNYQNYRDFSLIKENEQAEKIEAYLRTPVPALGGDSFRDVIDEMTAKGLQVYIIGGLIRDLLSLNPTEPRDIDFHYTGTIKELKEILESNHWPYTHLPNRYTLLIGDHRGSFMDAVPVDTSFKHEVEDSADEFTINNIFYHCNTRGFSGSSEIGFNDLSYDRLHIIAKDWKVWLYEGKGRRYYLIFRFWKMVGKGYIYSTEMADFFIRETQKIFEKNKEEFHEQLLCYLSEHYQCFDEIYKGSLAIMGYDWTCENLLSFRDEIERKSKENEEVRDKYTYFKSHLQN